MPSRCPTRCGRAMVDARRDAGPRSGSRRRGAQAGRSDRSRRGEAAAALRRRASHSGHNYELRYWLAACGIDPDRDVEIVIVPPPLMADALGSGTHRRLLRRRAVEHGGGAAGLGRIATVKAAIWRSSPEKVLGVAAQLGRATNPTRLPRCCARSMPLGAMVRRCRPTAPSWRDPARDAAYRRRVRPTWMLHGLTGELDAGGGDIRRVEDFFVPFAKAATFPWKSHALWFYSQMVRWGQVAHTPENAAIARETLSARPLSRRAEAARRRPARRQRQGRGRAAGADAGRLGGRQPDARPGWILRRRAVRSRPARRLHRRAEALARQSVQCTNFEPLRARKWLIFGLANAGRDAASKSQVVD